MAPGCVRSGSVETSRRTLSARPPNNGRVVGHDSPEASVSTTSTTYNPFGWRLAEIADPGTDDLRRRDLIESLLVAEAEELMLGRRHLTIVHGAPASIVDSEVLDAFYDSVFAHVAGSDWSRVRGTEDFVTVTVGGADAEEILLDLVELAHRTNAGAWQLIDRPFPNVE